MRAYELVFILQPNLEEEALEGAITSFQQVVLTNGGQVIRTERMGRRRLAYPIRRYREGHYVLMHLNLENATLRELERRLKLSEDVIRYLLVRLDEDLLTEPEAPAEEAIVHEAEAPVEAAPAEDETENDL